MPRKYTKRGSKDYLDKDQRIRNHTLVKSYGITLEEYNQLKQQQNYKCAICGKNERDVPKGLVVDHDHITGRVRELLCGSCNLGLGHFKDDAALLIKSIEYLSKHGREHNLNTWMHYLATTFAQQ